MTIQEAIDDIQNNILPVVGGKSLLMAIEALKAQDAKPDEKAHRGQGESDKFWQKTGETCADAISRQRGR